MRKEEGEKSGKTGKHKSPASGSVHGIETTSANGYVVVLQFGGFGGEGRKIVLMLNLRV